MYFNNINQFFFIVYMSVKEYIFEGYGNNKLVTINFSNHFKFSSIISEGMWDNSDGDYGNEKCSGFIEEKIKKVDLEIFVNQQIKMTKNSEIL